MKSNEVVIENGAVMGVNLPLPRVDRKTKIRELYDTSEFMRGTLLMVSTDKVSAFDIVMLSGIPGKGEVLNRTSEYWFKQTEQICPNHFITADFSALPKELQDVLEPYQSVLEGRFMLVLRTRPIPVECIPRNRLLGSVKDSYKKTGRICGIELPKGLKEGDRFQATIFTSSTKAEIGKHDENISFEEMIKIVGLKTARILRAYSLSIYSYIAVEAFIRGVEVPDTKFEFGYDEDGNIIQNDESGTGDSSRFNPDYSKQPLRNWLKLESTGWDGETPIELPEDVVLKTSRDYIKGCEILTGYRVIP
jgi:phosphoribosylaminoimidazole-succinocarboxamide synthase